MKGKLEIGRLVFDPKSGDLRTRVASRRLEPKAASVLTALLSVEGELVSRQVLLDRCWGEGEGSDEALTQAVAQIRRALDELGEPADLIETLAKRGYRLNAQLSLPESVPQDGHNYPLIRWSAAALIAAVAIGVIAYPHEIRHGVRHALGIGPSAASTQH